MRKFNTHFYRFQRQSQPPSSSLTSVDDKLKKLKQFGKRNIQGSSNHISNVDADLSSTEFNIQGDHNSIVIHANAFLKNVSFNIYGDFHRIVIGEGCHFNERGSLWAEDEHCLISIGRGTTFEGVHLSATEPSSRLIIGEDCMFSYDIDVRTGDSHSVLAKENGRRINYAKSIEFGDHIWVASHCIFTKGAKLPSNSVVGTGSLVNREFTEENCIIAGHPAKVIKQNIDWLRERVYHHKAESEPLVQQSRLEPISIQLSKKKKYA